MQQLFPSGNLAWAWVTPRGQQLQHPQFGVMQAGSTAASPASQSQKLPVVRSDCSLGILRLTPTALALIIPYLFCELESCELGM